MSENTELKFFTTDVELARAAARDWLDFLRAFAGPCRVALSGGRITKTFYAVVVEECRGEGVALGQVDFFFADERCVPPDHPDSNFLLANNGLFRPLAVATEKIHRLKGELDADRAIAEANAEIARVTPAFDLVFLGIGPDGHTCSLMPNAPPEVLNATTPYVKVENSPKPPPRRLTLTYPALAAAKNVWTLIAGGDKEAALRDSLAPSGRTPFGKVIASRRNTRIYSSVPVR